MPSTRLETRTGWIGARHAELVDAVQRALIEGIRILPDDRNIRILEYPPEAFAPPPGSGPLYTLIEISMLKGRSAEAKSRLYAALTRELGAFGLSADDLKILVHDGDFGNWGVRGKPLDAATIGFKVDV